MILLFFWGCVLPYGGPLVSHISEEKIVEAPVDFSPLYLKLDTLLAGETDRFTLQRLREYERFMSKAKGWEPSVQRDVYLFVEQLLERPKQEDVELQVSEPVKEMAFSMDSIPLEKANLEKNDERLHQADILAQSGDILSAIALLEECRDLPCWSDVYVEWARYSDIEFEKRIKAIKSNPHTVEEELLLWERLGIEFSHPTYQVRIEKEKQRLHDIKATP